MGEQRFRVFQRDDGWHAATGDEERIFASRDQAVAWCHARAVQGQEDAAPEEGAYGETRTIDITG